MAPLRSGLTLLCLPALLSLPPAASARSPADADPPPLRLVIENHRFSPEELRAPAGKPIVILIENRDDTPEEWESLRLRKEYGMRGHQSGRVVIKPQPAGRYVFQGEFHAKTAKGVLIVE